MFLVPAEREPDSLPELRRLLIAGLEQVFHIENAASRVTLEGGWPKLQSLSVNLTDINMDPLSPPATPGRLPIPLPTPTLNCGQLQLGANPLRVAEDAQLQFTICANGTEFTFAKDDREQLWLIPRHFESGSVKAQIAGRDLEHIFLKGAEMAAERHGVSIEEGTLQLAQADSRQVSVAAEITAKKLFVRSQLRLQGQVEIDPQLNIHFSQLTCSGKGMLASLACQFLQPHLDAWQEKPLPLLAVAFPEVRLHDATLATDGGLLRAEATFGGS